MRRLLCVLMTLCMLMGSAAWAEAAPTLGVQAVEETIRPGKAVLLTFTVPQDGEVDLCLEDERGNELSVVVLGYEVTAGENQVYWNGTYGGYPAPEGRFVLALTMNGERAAVPVTIGSEAPYMNNIRVTNSVVTPEEPLHISFYAGTAGRIVTGLRLGSEWRQVASWAVNEGENTLTWDAAEMENDGDVTFTMQLMAEDGSESTEEHLLLLLEGFGEPLAEDETVLHNDPDAVKGKDEPTAEIDDVEVEVIDDLEVEEVGPLDQSQFTPSYGSPYTGQDTSLNYWTLPMDITNEEAIWEMLMQPVTVVTSNKAEPEKQQEIIYQEPSKNSKGIGVVTCMTQSVHVLERGEDWTLIETYSASFHDSAVKNWNTLVQGYVPTSLLKTVTPNQTMGLVVDKLTQRLYIFREGKLYDTLVISTGLANADQPYNETRSGEFLLQNPAVGDFKSDNLTCGMGIRFNRGDLIHEVPHTTLRDGGKDYSSCEPKLGVKASHGCIRVQRVRTPKGTNMTWLWNNRADEMKIMIWEDWQGRVYPYPDDDTQLYYNPKGGTMYHTAEKCYSAPKITFIPFTYGELEDETFAKLTRCKFCAPPLRKAEIDAINAVYAPGGDHDPVMTAARAKAAANLGLTKEAAAE